jgi:hypothetical protein
MRFLAFSLCESVRREDYQSLSEAVAAFPCNRSAGDGRSIDKEGGSSVENAAHGYARMAGGGSGNWGASSRTCAGGATEDALDKLTAAEATANGRREATIAIGGIERRRRLPICVTSRLAAAAVCGSDWAVSAVARSTHSAVANSNVTTAGRIRLEDRAA